MEIAVFISAILESNWSMRWVAESPVALSRIPSLLDSRWTWYCSSRRLAKGQFAGWVAWRSSSQELVETRRELLSRIARGAKSWDLDSENSRKSALDRKDDPNARKHATCKHGTHDGWERLWYQNVLGACLGHGGAWLEWTISEEITRREIIACFMSKLYCSKTIALCRAASFVNSKYLYFPNK